VTRIALVALALGLSACASTSPAPAFSETAALVKARVGRPVFWDQGTAADGAVARGVQALLARPLTADASVQVALLRNRTLQATYEELSVAQADLVQAGLLGNPVFSASVALPVAGVADRGFGLAIGDDFVGLLTLAARKRVAESELQAAEARVADAVVRTTLDVESAFFRLVAAGQVLVMRRTVLDGSEAALEVARGQREAGNIGELDLANHELLVEQVRTDVVRSEADAASAREALTRLMGLWGPEAAYRVVDRLPELPAGELSGDRVEGRAVEQRLDLREAHAEAQALSHALAMTKNYRWLGAATAGVGFEKSPEGFSVVVPTAGVELPIFDAKQAAVARLEGRLRAALARETALAVDVRSQVREARDRLAAARTLVERYAGVVVPLRQRVTALSQQQYDSMLLGVYPLLLAKQNEVNTYREFIESLRDYWLARAELERAVGGALPQPS
jgi:cobalt-zinc-cadmium efflux system outer membrane protein